MIELCLKIVLMLCHAIYLQASVAASAAGMASATWYLRIWISALLQKQKQNSCVQLKQRRSICNRRGHFSTV
eukprot:1154963-Pelagomonas_calceolata.AAC.2